MKKKIIVLVLITIVLVISSIFGYKIYNNYKVKHAVKIVKLKRNEVDVFEELTLKDLIKEINGKLIENKKIDTTKIGNKKITFKYINNQKIEVPYTIEINIVDKVPPLIKKFSSYTINTGNNDFYSKFFCGDNYDNKPKCYIEGEYDVNTPGDYNLVFKGEDSSNNISESNFVLHVKEPSNESNNSKKDFFPMYPFEDFISEYKKSNTKIGIDISHYQGDIDFEKVKNAGVEFVYIRVGRGGGVGKEPVLDTKFKQNIKGFNKVGIPVGVYFYSYATSKKEAERDAKWVLKQIKNYKVDLEVAHDFEDWNDYNEYNLSFYNLSQIGESFNNEIKKAGYNGMLYSSKYYLENIWFKTNYPVWLAHYTTETNYEGKYKVWQISDSGEVDGIKNSLVDIDIMYE